MTGPITPEGQQPGTGTDPGTPPGTGQPGTTPPTTGQQAPQGGVQPPTEGDITSLPEWAQKAITDLRGEAGKARTTAKANAADEARQALAQDIGKLLGLVKEDEKLDPAQLSAQVGNLSGDLRSKTIELAAWRLASTHEADPQALTDSKAFDAATAALDPSAADFTEQLDAAIKKVVADNPRLKAAPAPAGPARSGGEFSGGPGASTGRPTSLHAAMSKALGG